jgi:hypothetical protein
MKKTALRLLSLLSFSGTCIAHDGNWTAARPDGHAPISVMGDHMHGMGEWMVSYRYMTMDMEGLLKGSNSVAPTLAATGFMTNMLPKTMTMDMHMFGAMHAISDKWTLMGMVNYLDNEMTMQSGTAMETSGLGDLKLAGLYDLASWDHGRRAHLNLGLSLPTGDIDERKANGDVMPYGMQLGSGTWDFHPGLTLLGQSDDYSWGAQVGGVFRIDDNDRDYSLGDRFEAALWGARKMSVSLSVSAKIDYSSQSEINGQDKAVTNMMKNMTPSYDSAHQGRDLTNFGLGINYYCLKGSFKGHRLAAEWETPISQNVNGAQLELDSTWTLGWEYAW